MLSKCLLGVADAIVGLVEDGGRQLGAIGLAGGCLRDDTFGIADPISGLVDLLLQLRPRAACRLAEMFSRTIAILS